MSAAPQPDRANPGSGRTSRPTGDEPSWTDTSVCFGHPEYPAQAEAVPLLRAMDTAGIDQAWVFGYGAVATHDFAAANAGVRELVTQHADRFVPIGLINPFYAFPAVDELLDEGFRSIKILTGWGNWLTIGNVRRVVVPITQALQRRSLHVSIALEGNIPVTGGSTFLPLIVREACPDACIVLDHCWLPSAWEDYLALAQDDRDLWFTLHSLPQALLTRVVRELGLARILLGSWLPETDPDLVYAQLRRAAGVGDELAVVLRDNAARVLQGLPPRRASRTHREPT
jgi:predicted TIM-barrel fold metal-dependent hydrolase